MRALREQTSEGKGVRTSLYKMYLPIAELVMSD